MQPEEQVRLVLKEQLAQQERQVLQEIPDRLEVRAVLGLKAQLVLLETQALQEFKEQLELLEVRELLVWTDPMDKSERLAFSVPQELLGQPEFRESLELQASLESPVGLVARAVLEALALREQQESEQQEALE